MNETVAVLKQVYTCCYLYSFIKVILGGLWDDYFIFNSFSSK